MCSLLGLKIKTHTQRYPMSSLNRKMMPTLVWNQQRHLELFYAAFHRVFKCFISCKIKNPFPPDLNQLRKWVSSSSSFCFISQLCLVRGARQAGRKQMESDVWTQRKETSCHFVYSAALSSTNNQLHTGLIHLPHQPRDKQQLISLHTEQRTEEEQLRQETTVKLRCINEPIAQHVCFCIKSLFIKKRINSWNNISIKKDHGTVLQCITKPAIVYNSVDRNFARLHLRHIAVLIFLTTIIIVFFIPFTHTNKMYSKILQSLR